jgi:hypothetical protein
MIGTPHAYCDHFAGDRGHALLVMATLRSRHRAGGRIVWLAYPLWEFALQIFAPEVNIRVDLVLFHPILLITGVLGHAFGLASREVTLSPEAR